MAAQSRSFRSTRGRSSLEVLISILLVLALFYGIFEEQIDAYLSSKVQETQQSITDEIFGRTPSE